MKRIRLDPNILFFATSEEIAAWARQWIINFDLYFLLCRHISPKLQLIDIPWSDPLRCLELFQNADTLMLRREPINLSVKNMSYLPQANPNTLYVNFPVLRDEGLQHGMFGTGKTDSETLEVWQRIGQDFFAKTEAGMWYKYRTGGRVGSRFVNDIRYTAGSAALLSAGVNLVGLGNDTWHIEKPTKRKGIDKTS